MPIKSKLLIQSLLICALLFLQDSFAQYTPDPRCGPLPRDGKRYSCSEETGYKWLSSYDQVPQEVREAAKHPLDYKYETTSLGQAAKKGKLKRVRKLIDKKGDPVDIRDTAGRTPLMMAAWKGHVETMEYLISKGADVNAIDLRGGDVSFYAKFSKNQNAIDLIAQSGVSSEIIDSRRKKLKTARAIDGSGENSPKGDWNDSLMKIMGMGLKDRWNTGMLPVEYECRRTNSVRIGTNTITEDYSCRKDYYDTVNFKIDHNSALVVIERTVKFKANPLHSKIYKRLIERYGVPHLEAQKKDKEKKPYTSFLCWSDSKIGCRRVKKKTGGILPTVYVGGFVPLKTTNNGKTMFVELKAPSAVLVARIPAELSYKLVDNEGLKQAHLYKEAKRQELIKQTQEEESNLEF